MSPFRTQVQNHGILDEIFLCLVVTLDEGALGHLEVLYRFE